MEQETESELLLRKFKAFEARQERKRTEENKVRNVLEDKEKGEVIYSLRQIGAFEVTSNGYVYDFKNGNRTFRLRNQTNRVVGSSYLTDQEGVIRIIKGDYYDKSGLMETAITLSDYREYCVDGDFRCVLIAIAENNTKWYNKYREFR